jgi:hypothetical protein
MIVIHFLVESIFATLRSKAEALLHMYNKRETEEHERVALD